MDHDPAPSTSSGDVAGREEPRLWTPPLRELTPATSYGFDAIDFASTVLEVELDPWQRWLAVHMGELLPDGRPRFRTVLALVARQNGKTLLAKVLILYWLTIERTAVVLGTSTDRSYAKKAWESVVAAAESNDWIDPTVRRAIGEEALIIDGCAYYFAANNERAGRSLSIDRWLCDELRQHTSFDTWGAATGAMNARPNAQVVCITNQGDVEAVVLDSLRSAALDHLETGRGDPRLGLFEWSSPDGAEPDDIEALAAANPNLGRRVDVDALLGAGRRAMRAGGEELAVFRTESMCQRVHLMDAAIDAGAWARCSTTSPVDLAEHRRRVALCLDVALDGSHISLVAAAVVDGVAHIDVVAAWEGHGCVGTAKRRLPGVVAKVRPAVVGWFPNGPAAALAAELRANWVPKGTKVEEVKGDMPAVCMGLAAEVVDLGVRHSSDPMLDRHISTAQRLRRGDVWVFTRHGSDAIDGAYAAAGAVHLARTMKPPRPPLAVVK